MPKGIKKKNKKTSTKNKMKTDKVTNEVIDIFFNTEIKDEESLDTISDEPNEIDDSVESLLDPLEDKEILKEIEAPETIAIEGEDSEQLLVTSSFSDDGETLHTIQSIRKNLPPRETWASKECRFKTGQKIMPITLKKANYSTYEAASVISPGIDKDTFFIKISRSMNEICVKGSEWTIADKACKPYVSYWDSLPIIKVRK
jgi:hypothetical protein